MLQLVQDILLALGMGIVIIGLVASLIARSCHRQMAREHDRLETDSNARLRAIQHATDTRLKSLREGER